MMICTRCGNELEENARFCNKCGAPSPAFNDISNEDAPTLNLPKPTAPQPLESRPTQQMTPGQTGSGLPTGPAYIPPDSPPKQEPDYPPSFLYQQPTGPQPPPPVGYGQPYQQPNYYQPAPGYLQPAGVTPQPPPIARTISLGDWLSYGWRVYSENWFVMSLATLLVMVIGIGTIGILAGPMVMGLFRMAFKTMKGERPEIADLFNWEGKFLQAFLAFIIYAAIYGSIQGVGGRSGALSAILSFLIGPFLTMLISFSFPMLLEGRKDIAAAINDIGKRIFTRDALMWWIVGLVFGLIAWSGSLACGIGIFVTVPWIVSAAAVAYSNIWGIDDPNRTNA
ncbi:MAG: zinc-ribbon domain-containing protein [Acidobacteriota bacterium]